MTREEAIRILKNDEGYDVISPDADEAIKLAIRSLEAWDAVVGEITEYIEEYNDVDADGNHSPKWCAMKEAESVIKKHLKEVKE